MGCDIHLYVETRNANGEWVNVPAKGHMPLTDFHTKYGYDPDWFEGRSYDTFAILANVRNGHGFAGVKTGDGFRPIAKPRGLPKDTSAEVRRGAVDWGIDGHSHSWLTVAEIDAYDWDQETFREGVVGPVQFCVHLHQGSPNSWSGGVGGGNVAHIDNNQMRRYICTTYFGETISGANRDMDFSVPEDFAMASATREVECVGMTPPDDEFDPQKSYYTAVRWGIRYKDAAAWFYNTLLPKLRDLGDPENVRIVFWFDN